MDNTDPEFEAMGQIYGVLEALPDSDARERVIAYVSNRLRLKSFPDTRSSTATAMPPSSPPAPALVQSLPDLFEATEPSGEAAKVLTVAYWFQVVQANPDWESLGVNTELKHLGHGVSNITKVIDRLMAKKPQLVLQTRKSGTSQQARKKYKLTREGIKFVEERLSGRGVNDDE